MAEGLDVEQRRERADQLKERIYITFAALAVVLALNNHDSEAGKSLLTLIVTVLGATLALFLADLISHLVVQEQMFGSADLRRALATSFGAVSVVFVPAVFLLLAVFGVWPTSTALTASAYVLIGSLVVIGLVATRRVPMSWWQRVIALGAEAALGLAVIGLQVLAKS